MAVNRTSTRVLGVYFFAGWGEVEVHADKVVRWYDLMVPQRCSVPFGPISTIWPPGFASTRIALAGAPPMADTLKFAERPPAVHFVQKYIERFGLAAGNLDGLDDRSSITFSFSVSCVARSQAP